jgi:hypothetical protein
MPKVTVGAHLPSEDGVKYCSVYNQEFPADSKPSISKDFGQHVREKRQRLAVKVRSPKS